MSMFITDVFSAAPGAIAARTNIRTLRAKLTRYRTNAATAAVKITAAAEIF